MRKFFYLISLFIFSILFSCSKGEPVQDPQFGDVSLVNSSSENIFIIQGDHTKLVNRGDNFALSIPSGKSRFKFYLKDTLTLDTVLPVKPYTGNIYTLFKPSANTDLRIIDDSLNGLNKEVIPDSGFLKISLANFSKSLPDKINIDIATTTYIPFSYRAIQVAENISVSSSFSPFKTIIIGVNQSTSLKVVNVFTLTVKDPINNSVLATIPLTIPSNISSATAGKLIGSVFLIYINENGTASILMSK
ncbi:hypothetical protein [Pedobacter hartonius]|uniref:DUF4397 domain-containing protein n=1 Tax=Pedobacter hartonius TaxID=425514 RepID=A0A1H3WAA6_9SPHI|nr:hypothetical protein [Pedobacter hartonius]SDZ83208.1 hypothetical protein SAMN05443550_101137 [Pedobacter hartonius]